MSKGKEILEMANPSTEQIKREVRRAYGRVARQFALDWAGRT